MNDELLHDALVFGVDSDTVRKKCIAEGNKVTNRSDSWRNRAHRGSNGKMQLATMTNYNQVNFLDKKDFSKGKTQPKENLERSEEVTKGKNLKQTDTSKSGCGRCGGAPLQQKCKAINSKCPNSHEVGPYQCMCFKMKPSGVNRLHGERSNPGESDPYVNILLGTLTAEHCSQSNN